MLRRKLATLILVATMTNLAATPIEVLAETLNDSNIESQEVQEKKVNIRKFNLSNNSKLEDYNAIYKVDRSNIKSIENNGGQYSDRKIERAIDGNYSTFWETGTENSANFTNEVIVTFNEIEELNRITYAARQDGDKGKGFAEEVEIYSSTTDEGDDFELVGNGTYTESKTNIVEMKFDTTKFKRLKFVFKKANRDWASASEFMFYKEDKALDKVEGLFKDSTMSTVSEAYNTVESINALEDEFKSHVLYDDYKEDFENARALLEEDKIEASEASVSKFDEYYSNEREAYDNEFKMDNSNIKSITSAGGNLRDSVGTSKIIDGDLNTYWETGKHTSSTFNNELIFTLEEATVLNRIAYRSAWNTVGFAEDFEVWASNTSK